MPTYLSTPSSILLSVAASFLLRVYARSSYIGQSSLLTSFIIFLLISISRAIWNFSIYPRYWSPLRHLPQPPDKPAPLMGYFWLMMKSSPGAVMRSWANNVPNDGIIRYLDFFNLERLAVVGPAALADVLVHNCYDFEKPPQIRKGISRILGLGLFLSEGDVHKACQGYVSYVLEPVERISGSNHLYNPDSDKLGPEKGIKIEVNEWASRATLDIVGQGGFGQSFNALQDPNNALSQTYRGLFKPGRKGQILGVLGLFLPQSVVRQMPLLRNDQMKRSSNFLRSFCRSCIDSKRRKLEVDPDGGLDILTAAMQSGTFSDEDLVDQMMTFLAAGHETTASALTWAVYLLSKHPETQTRLRKEVQSVLPHPLDDNSSQTVTSEAIEKMSYLNMVCREVLRLFPPVSVTIRVAVRDTTINGHFIPKGTTILLPPWAVNVNTELWGPDAADFNPQRWQKNTSTSSTTDTKSTNYRFMTFLHGPRSCIGQGFAMGEFQCLVAAWVTAFETELQDQGFVPVVKGGISAKPKDGLHVVVKPLAVVHTR